MILEQETKQKYGYESSFIGLFSCKKVIIRCDYCQKIEEIQHRKIARSSAFSQSHTCSNKECVGKKRSEATFKTKTINNAPEIGTLFGKLTVISPPFFKYYKDGHGFAAVRCKCRCGKEKDIAVVSLNKGSTKSCACGETKTKLYIKWLGMKQRCNPLGKTKGNLCYREKGIEVCSQWKYDFIIFKEWALKNGYEPHLTIDRIDSDGNYCPENCRWIPWIENTKAVAVQRKKKKLEMQNKILVLEKELKQYKDLYGEII